MLARAAVAVAAGSDLVVETAVDLLHQVSEGCGNVHLQRYVYTLSCSVPKMEAR